MISALIRLTRPYYSLPLSSGLVVISLYVVGGDISLIGIKLVYAFLSLLFILSAAYTLNDICDIAVDMINSPEKTLPKGQISRKYAFISSYVLFFCGIGLGGLCGWKFLGLLLLVIFGLIIYDLYSKKIGVFKDILVAILTTSLYPLSFALAEVSITPRLKSLYIFPIWLFLTTTGYEMLKDIRDIKGDSTVKTITLRVDCSSPRFLLLARILLVLASLLTVLPYALGYCNHIYLISSILAIILVFLSLRQAPSKAIRYIYAEVFIITAGSLVDLLVYGA